MVVIDFVEKYAKLVRKGLPIETVPENYREQVRNKLEAK